MILRLLGGRIDEGSHKASTICNHQLQRSRCGSLVMPRTVVGIPHQDGRHRTIHSRRHQESHPVLHFRVVDADISYDGISDDSWDQGEKHDDATKLQAVGDNGNDDSQDGGDGVWNYGPELGFICCIAELDDDRRKLKRVRDWRKRARAAELTKRPKE